MCVNSKHHFVDMLFVLTSLPRWKSESSDCIHGYIRVPTYLPPHPHPPLRLEYNLVSTPHGMCVFASHVEVHSSTLLLYVLSVHSG